MQKYSCFRPAVAYISGPQEWQRALVRGQLRAQFGFQTDRRVEHHEPLKEAGIFSGKQQGVLAEDVTLRGTGGALPDD